MICIKLYLDANILNRLAYVDNYKIVFQRLKEKKYIICISEVTILEILRDRTDLNNIDKIVTMLQEANEISKVVILPSINQIIMNHVKGRKSYSSKCKTIVDVINNKRMAFITDYNFDKYSIYFKELQKMFRNDIKKAYKDECPNCNNFYCDNMITSIAQALVYLFFKCDYCIFDRSTMPLYWKRKKINSEQEKDRIITEITPVLIDEISPIRNMARMIISQKRDMTNGIFGDGLHLLYLEYVDYYVSNDNDFNELLKNVITFDELLGLVNLIFIKD